MIITPHEKMLSKIVSLDILDKELARMRFYEHKIVFTNGCFDIVHRGHVEYLAKAASLGKTMVLGLNTDASVKRLKGNDRPLQDEYSRALVLSAFTFIDYIVYFDEDTPYELIKRVQPDILVKGSDYKAEDIVGYDIVKARGGEIITIDLVAGHSTTNIINKICK